MKLLVKVYMSQETFDALEKREDGKDLLTQGDILGVPIIIDNRLPFKVLDPVYIER